jgi:uncharacterized damage-inducible protein DinB
MTVNDLEILYDYDRWANDKLFRVVSQLTPDQFTQSVAGSYGSIRNTMVHVFSAEWGWLDRCGGAARGERLDPANYPTVQSLVAMWHKIDGYIREFLSGVTDEDISRNVEYQMGQGPKRSMPLGELMQHAVVHAVHHRGQVALLLRTLGVVPGNFDILFYYAEKHSVAAV